METTTILKKLAIIGLACFGCVVVVNFARSGKEKAFESVQRSSEQPAAAFESVHELGQRRSNEIFIADRIPTVDISSSEYPVQLAAFDSITWQSETITPHRVTPSIDQTPPTGTKDTTADQVRVAKLPGKSAHFQPIWKQPNAAARPIGTAPSNPKPKKKSHSTEQKAKVIVLKDVHPKGKRIDGLTTKQLGESKKTTDQREPLRMPRVTNSPSRAKNSPTQSASTSNVRPLSAEGKTPKRIQGIRPKSSSKIADNKSPMSNPSLDPRRGNFKRAVVSNPHFQRNVQTDRNDSFPRKSVVQESATDQVAPVSNRSNDFVSVQADDKSFRPVANSQSTTGDPAEPPPRYELADSKAEKPSEPASPSVKPERHSLKNGNDIATRIAGTPPNSKMAPPEPRATSRQPDVNAKPASQPRVGGQLPGVLQGAENFVLAAQPQPGDQWFDGRPVTDKCAWPVDPIKDDFSPDPIAEDLPYDPYQQMEVYEGKQLYANQRPLVELGRPWYQLGQLSPGYSWLGKHNNITPQFLIYGDMRSAIGSSSQNGDNVSELAYEVNLDFDLKLTSTERFHMFMAPFDNGVENARWLLDEGEFVDQYDADIDFGYFEGDLGAIVGGFVNKTLPFDLPFTLGIIPMVIQNGVWMEDAFLGAAATIPARTIPRFNVSNMDVTFFAGFDKINSDGFPGDDSASKMYGIATFIDAMNGYFEIDYAFLEDRTFDDRSYHNIGFAFTRRFGRLFSNSTRIIVNAGQSTDVVENTADGVLLLSENSLITGAPSTLVPYLNLFAGFDRPQSAARAAQAGGVLRNTGILFEIDGMTNYPTLDPTANDTYGGAMGLNLLASDFSQQLIVEMAALGVMKEDANRIAPGPQYGVAFRYQLPLTNALIFRSDGMYGFLEDSQDVRGLRFELRHKY